MPSETNMIHCKRDGKWLFFKTDRYGFNNKDSNWENYNTVMIGDSFGIGECVNYEDSLSGNLEKSQKIDGIINLSQTGNGPLLEFAILKEYAEFDKIKNLIWFYFEGNDLLELRNELKNNQLIKYIDKSNHSKQNLENYRDDINNHVLNFIKRLEIEQSDVSTVELGIKENPLKKYINFIKLHRLRSIIEIIDYIKETIATRNKNFENIILRINDNIKENNARLYFVYLPTLRDFYNDKEKEKFEISRKNIKNFLRENKIKMIDIYSQLYVKLDNPYELFDKKNGHYTIWGYKSIVEIINKEIGVN